MKDRIKHRTKRVLAKVSPQHVVSTRLATRAIRRFADETGLVYFGYVSQRSDEHRLVRGFTASRTHTDDNYCVGTIKGYDVTVVTRSDTVITHDKRQANYWLIVTFDLHTHRDVPHVYLGNHRHRAAYEAKFPKLIPLSLGVFGQYPPKFLANYTVHGSASQAVEIEQVISPPLAGVVESHFEGASVEIEDNTVYLYIEARYPNETILEKMVSNGLWLAASIDARLVEQSQVATD